MRLEAAVEAALMGLASVRRVLGEECTLDMDVLMGEASASSTEQAPATRWSTSVLMKGTAGRALEMGR